MSRLKNTLRMLHILSIRDVISIQELSERLEVSHRTIQRMKDDLCELGYEIESHFGPSGGLKLVGSSKLHPLDFTSNEIKDISMGLKHLMASKSNLFSHSFKDTISKLHHQFDQITPLEAITTLQKEILILDQKAHQKYIELLDLAINEHRRVLIQYERLPKESKTYIFEPYQLIVIDQRVYIFGYEKAGRKLSLRLSRIKKITLMDEKFRVDDTFSILENLTQFGFKINPVRIKAIITNRSDIAEYWWGKDQKITWLNENSFELEVTFSNTLVAQEFILKLSHYIEVQEPLSLRKWIQEEIELMRATYEPS